VHSTKGGQRKFEAIGLARRLTELDAPKDFSFHVARPTLATWLQNKGFSEWERGLVLNHAGSGTIEAISPNMMIGGRFDELTGDAYTVRCLSHAAFEHIADAQFTPDLLHVNGFALVAGDDEKRTHRDRAVMMSSTMPSAKYSCSRSPLMFWKGNTASGGLFGSESTGRSPPALVDAVSAVGDEIR
jgi:hypothetical protein